MKLIILSLLVLALVACGGGGKSASKLAADDVAVVGSTHVKVPLFTDLMAQAKQSFKAQGQAWPKAGTTGYATIKGEAVTLMVQSAEREQKATDLGITVTTKQIDARLAALKKQYFGGSETKYKAQLKAQGLTDALVRFDVESQLVQEKLFAKVTKSVTVNSRDVQAYYAANLTAKYTQPESRDLRHILVKSKTLAASIFKQLTAGNDQTWCTLAKKYSQDPSSKDKCGKLTVTKGETVPVFDQVAFSQPTKKVHAPVYDAAQYKAYFIIEPLSPIRPAKTTPETKVAASIKQTLLTTKKNDAMTAWVNQTAKGFCSGKQVVYQAGYAPSPDPCTTLTSSTATNNTTT
jgi:parvulin-like peptidyl-prolyl isomerase